jgi:AICAR transformylase/IMP cyclohydrolase PurH
LEVLISNTTIDVTTAAEINKLFCEVVIALTMMKRP